jgi:hypothetical protein
MQKEHQQSFKTVLERKEYIKGWALAKLSHPLAEGGKDKGVTNICRLSWPTNSALVYEPKCGGRGRGRGEEFQSQPLSAAVLYTGDQINFGDLIPHLTYGKGLGASASSQKDPPHRSIS